MKMAAKLPTKLSFLMVHCVGVVLSASYYQGDYSGYSFTIPGFNDMERRSQTDARTWCNQNKSKLLAITNQSIQSAAVAFINEAIKQNQMTGNTIITDGQRANGDWTWINGTKTSPNLAIGGQSEGAGYSVSYAYLDVSPSLKSLGLSANLPTDKKYFICEGSAFCGNGSQIQGQCFRSFRNGSDEVSWFEARNRCLQRGGDLATFEFITTNEGLNTLNGSWLTPQTQYWIGLRRQWWTWPSISSDVTYSQWSDGHPIYNDNPQCLCLLPNVPAYDWKWSECLCSQTFQFICISSAAAQTSSTSLKPSTVSTRLTSALTSVLTPQSTMQSTAIQTSASNESISYGNLSSSGNGVNRPLAIGLGVGLGGGILLIVAIVVIVFILCSRKGRLSFRRKRTAKASDVQQSPPDVVLSPPPNAIYAEIAKIPENSMSTPQDTSNESSQTPIEYATLEIVKDRKRLIGTYGHNARKNSKSEL